MSFIKDFIIQYRYVIYIVVFVLEFLFSIFLIFLSILRFILSEKKSPYVKEFILEKLPAVINLAETMFENGKDKKRYVLDTIINCIRDNFPKINSSIFLSFINGAIEKFLSTPQKKEDK